MIKTPFVQAVGNAKPRKLTHLRLKEQFYEEIKKGRWSVNEKIPSENVLAQQYQVSRETVRKALKTLENEGVLRAEQGRGRVVTSGKVKQQPQNKTVGIIIHSTLSEDVYNEFTGMHNTLNKSNYNLTLYSFNKNAPSLSSIENISNKQVAGLLIYCQQILKQDIIEFNKYINVVALFHKCSDFGVPSYYMSWPWVCYEASCHLFEQDDRRQIITIPRYWYFKQYNEQITEGFSYAHHKHNRNVSASDIIRVSSEGSIEQLIPEVLESLKRGEKLSVISYYNNTSVELVKFAVKNGISVPEQLKVISLQDSSYLDNSPIPITAFEFDRCTLVQQGTARLIDIIEEKGDTENNLDNPFYGKLLIRESTCDAG